MKEYVKNAVKSALSKPLRERYRRLLSICVSALLAVSTFLTVFPQMSVPVYAAGTGKNIQLGAGALAPEMTSVEDSYDCGPKSRVTTAQKVYYGSKEWRVIGLDGSGAVSESGTVTLFAADNLIKGQSYKGDNSSNSYVSSDIKPVVDGYYSSLFSPAEQSAINERTLAHGVYDDDYSNFCDGISDTNNPNSKVKLWLLSTKEADLIGQSYRTANDYWWLRSPGHDVFIAANVTAYGIVDFLGIDVNTGKGVRPAFNINLSSIILTSAAVGGKDPGTRDAGTLNKVDAYSGDAWKLTISDSTRSSFTASAGTGATVSMPEGYTSWSVPVTYSNAKTGANEHVSAILTNSSGDALYYGYIATNSSDGTKDVTISTGLAKGTYTLNVFNEQCNGNKKTDLSSPIKPITLTVGDAYDLVYDSNGGTGTMDPETVTIGSPYRFPECSFSAPTGKAFANWKITGEDGIHDPGTALQGGIVAQNILGGKVTVTAYWKDTAIVKVKPEGKTLKYNGSEQELVSAGEAENGTMYYAIGDDDTTAPDTGWSETVPKKKDIDTYYVWYKAKGNGEYADSDPGCTTATISDKDPVKVEKVELSDDKLTLSPGESEQITATIFPKNAADQTVSWKVGDESIIKITSDGKVCTVTAVATGETVVTVTTEDGGKEAVCTVIVEEEPNPKPDKCKISFAANGGEGEMKDQTVDKGIKTQLNANTFTRDGYTFDSWNTQADGKGKSYDDKDYITVEKDITLYAQWEKGKPRPTPRKHDDDEEEIVEESKPAVVNPDTVEGYFATNGQLLPGVTMGKTKQGVAAQAIFNASRPAGWQEAFTFNMAINGKVDYTLKNGVLTIIIPKEFQKAGRTFAIMALDKNGKAWTFADTDTNPNTVTAIINVEGYAFALIYKD